MEHMKSDDLNASPKVSREQLLHFIEAKFQQADRDHDGELDITELGNFLRFVSHPDLRALRSWERYREAPHPGH